MDVFFSVVGTLVVLFVIHALWGQYWLNPQRKLDHHIARCPVCQVRSITNDRPLSDWLCPSGQALYRQMLRRAQ